MTYYLPSGKAMYLAHRKRREVFHAKNAWTLDLSTLNMLKSQGITVVGVICKAGNDKLVWMTDIEDFFGAHSFAHFGDSRQRGLPLSRFKLNPGIIERHIRKAIKLR
jgi:hypothetical protein